MPNNHIKLKIVWNRPESVIFSTSVAISYHRLLTQELNRNRIS